MARGGGHVVLLHPVRLKADTTSRGRHQTYLSAMTTPASSASSAVACLCGFALALGVIAHAQAELDVLQIRPNVYMIAGAGANITVDTVRVDEVFDAS